MGFDNECILNIQSLAGEYFCPVCRLLVYPNEALQSQCTHLYCKPCLTYIVSTTRACPYDGYLVTEADSKPLIESNKALAETIGTINVRCLYHRSGCTWQGPLSNCTTHCSECAFGNSPVVCNRCAVQILHRQVQEHAQNCPGVQPQVQQPQGGQEVAATGTATGGDQTQIAAQAATAASQLQTTTAQTAGQNVAQPANTNSQVQVVAQGAVPTAEQWYQQQYQQYYQSYHGYDPYQQHYQPQQFQDYAQAQSVSQPQLQPQIQSQSQPQSQPQIQSQSQPQSHPQLQAPPHFQAPMATQPQNALVSSQNPAVQSYPQAHPVHPHPQHPQIPQYQQSHLRMQDSQLQSQNQAVLQPPANAIAQQTQVQAHAQPQPQPQPQHQALPQPQPQHQAHPQPQPQHLAHPQAQPQLQAHPQPHPIQAQPQHSIHGVAGYQSYPQHQTFQQMQLGAQQNQLHVVPRAQSQHPTQIPGQFPQQQPLLRPSHSHSTIPNYQPPALLPSPGQVANALPAQHSGVHPHAHQPGLSVPQRLVTQPIQRPIGQQFVLQQQPFARPPMGQVQNQMNQQNPYAQQLLPLQSQLHLQGSTLPQQAHVYPQVQQNSVMPANKPQNLSGKPVMPIHGVQSQPYPQTTSGMKIGPTLQSANIDQVQLSSEQQLGVSSRPAIAGKQGDLTFEKSVADLESELSVERAVVKESHDLDAKYGIGGDASDTKTLNSVTDKPANDDIKRDPKVEEKSSLADASTMENPESCATKNRESVIKHSVKEEGMSVTEDKKDVSSVDDKIVDHVLPGDKKLESHLLDEESGNLQKDKSGAAKQFQYQSVAADEFQGLPTHGVQAEGPFTDLGRNQAPPSHYGPPALQDRFVAPSLFPAKLPGDPSSQSGPLPHQGQPSNAPNLQPHEFRQLHSTKSGIFGPGDAASFGNGPGHGGPQHRIEQQSVTLQGPYTQVHLPPPHAGPPRISHGEPTGGMPSGTLLSSAFDSQSGMMTRAPHYGPEGRMGYQGLMGTEIRPNQRPGYMNGREPDLHFPGSLGPGFGLQNERFKPFSEDHLNPLPLDPGQRIFVRGKFEEDLKKFPRSSSLENEPLPRFEYDLSSSSTLDRGHPGFGMDPAPGPRGKRPHGPNNDPMLKVDPAAGPVSSRFLPLYAGGGKLHPTDAGERIVGRREDGMGKLGSDHTHPDFLGPVPGYGRYHSDGLPARSPVREYPGMMSRGFRGLPDGRESDRFGDPIGHPFHESRFPILPSNMRRGEFEGPGSYSLSGHSRRAEHLGSHNLHGHLRLVEPVGFGAFPGRGQTDLAGPGNFPRPRLGEPGFRSSFSLQGEVEPFDSTRKRKPASMGWCRICKQDCGSVEGLEMHSQTREHQRKAIDMVSIIKENAKKQKIVPNDRTTFDEASKSKNAVVEGRWSDY